MENKLKKLFDFQKFEKNGKLEKQVGETESRYAAELSDDELSLVNAAGIGGATGKAFNGGLVGNAATGTVGGSNTGDITGDFTENYI